MMSSQLTSLISRLSQTRKHSVSSNWPLIIHLSSVKYILIVNEKQFIDRSNAVDKDIDDREENVDERIDKLGRGSQYHHREARHGRRPGSLVAPRLTLSPLNVAFFKSFKPLSNIDTDYDDDEDGDTTDLQEDGDDDDKERIGEIEEEPHFHRLDVGSAGEGARDGEVDGGQDHHGGDVELQYEGVLALADNVDGVNVIL